MPAQGRRAASAAARPVRRQVATASKRRPWVPRSTCRSGPAHRSDLGSESTETQLRAGPLGPRSAPPVRARSGHRPSGSAWRPVRMLARRAQQPVRRAEAPRRQVGAHFAVRSRRAPAQTTSARCRRTRRKSGKAAGSRWRRWDTRCRRHRASCWKRLAGRPRAAALPGRPTRSEGTRARRQALPRGRRRRQAPPAASDAVTHRRAEWSPRGSLAVAPTAPTAQGPADFRKAPGLA